MWKSYNDGLRWRVLQTGEVEVQGRGILRTKGAPLTMLYLVREWGAEITRAATLADIPREWLAAMITVEAARLRRRPLSRLWSQVRTRIKRVAKGRGWRAATEDQRDVLERRNHLRMDPVSVRKEPGYVSPQDTPGRISATLPQVLLSTAQEMAGLMDLKITVEVGESGLKYEMSLGQVLIFDPQLALICAARYMRWQLDRYDDGIDGHEMDFVHMTGAYNAGSVKPDTSRVGRNPFGILAYHKWRTDKAVRSLNDCYTPVVQAAWP